MTKRKLQDRRAEKIIQVGRRLFTGLTSPVSGENMTPSDMGENPDLAGQTGL
jgi:hypothetical protein